MIWDMGDHDHRSKKKTTHTHTCMFNMFTCSSVRVIRCCDMVQIYGAIPLFKCACTLVCILLNKIIPPIRCVSITYGGIHASTKEMGQMGSYMEDYARSPIIFRCGFGAFGFPRS